MEGVEKKRVCEGGGGGSAFIAASVKMTKVRQSTRVCVWAGGGGGGGLRLSQLV